MLLRLINALKKPFSPPELNQVIFFVTSKCNLRCRNCFNWMNLNKKDDLKLGEIIKISNNLPSFPVLLISGGEPFLNDNLPKIIKQFRTENKINFVGIPTNGSMGNRMVEKLKEILEQSPELSVNLYFSIDGMAPFHDSSRGIKGSFGRSVDTLKRTVELKQKYRNLSVNVNTVISSENMNEIPKLMNFVFSFTENSIDGHYFELVRGSPKDPSVKKIDATKLKQLYKKILAYQEKIYQRREKGDLFRPILAKLATINLSFLYKTQYENYFNKGNWPMKCLAGINIIVIDSNGDFRLCELREPILNLKKESLNVNKIFTSKKMKDELLEIEKTKCYCTHACFISESMYKSPKIVFWNLPLLLIKSLIGCHFVD